MPFLRPLTHFRPLLPRLTPRRAGLLAGTVMLLVTCVSGLALYLLGLRALHDEVRANLLRSALTIGTLVNGDSHKQFTRREQESGAAYARAIAPLQKVLAVRPDVKFVYTCVLVRGKVFFVLDPTAPGDHDGDGVDDKSHIFQPYPDASPTMLHTLRTGRPDADDKPYQDEWGVFMSGYAPVRDVNGRLVAALGVDVSADEYLARIAKMKTAAGFGLALALVLSAAVGAAVYRLERSALAARTAQVRSAERLRGQNETLVELARGRTVTAPAPNGAASGEEADALLWLREITEASARTLDVERVSVWLYTDEQASAIRCLNLFERGPGRHSEGVVLAQSDFPAYFHALREERTIAAHDARTDPRTREFDAPYLSALGITSLLDAPIRLNGRMAGVVCHEQVGPARHWELEEENFAGSIADAVALVLESGERRRAERALRRAHDELETRVAERTDALARANDALRGEIAERRRAEETVRWQANHDALTGLPNRVLFGDRLEQAIVRASRAGSDADACVAVLFLDLDRFKNVNDTLGHLAGDQLLTEVAARLSGILRPGDTVARMGGDEFTVLLPRLAQPDEAARVARTILDALSVPMTIARHELVVSASIGVSVFPHDGRDVSSLLKHADVAMYRAKEQGRSGYQLYTQALNEAADRRFRLEADLRHVLDAPDSHAHGLFLMYQPQVALASGRVTGVEALVRWNHPAYGLVPPSEFVPLAEEMGLIAPLGQWVLGEACRQAAVWHAAGHELQTAVNLSARQFRQKDLAEMVARTLEQTGLDPAHLDLELTETAIMNDGEAAVEALHALKHLGVCLSVDDFGTGYSSLSYLRRFPLDTLKVDRSFVGDIAADLRDRAVVQALIELAHALDMTVVAEGVETISQRDCLRTLGCDIMQGFLFSRPLLAPAVDALLQHCDPRPASVLLRAA